MTEELKPGYERVHTVTDYYDGPRVGIADYQGEPHLYKCIFDEDRDNYSELFHLAPVDKQTFQLAIEDWSIWKRWELAFHSDRTDLSTHPALPNEAARHAQLKAILDEKLVIDPVKAVTRLGFFEILGNTNLPKGVIRSLQVKWTEPQAGPI